MSLDLTDSLKSSVESESSHRGFVLGKEFVLELLQKEDDRAYVRRLINEAESLPAKQIDIASYIASRRDRLNVPKDHYQSTRSPFTQGSIQRLKILKCKK